MTRADPRADLASDHDPDDPAGNPGETGMRDAAPATPFPAGWILRGPVAGLMCGALVAVADLRREGGGTECSAARARGRAR